MTLLEVDSIQCQYDGHDIVKQLSFSVEAGEIATVLGPSGCGKTTTLRAILGFEPVVQGCIRIADKVVSSPAYSDPPEQRSVGMVFQDQALFPHLTVHQNIALGVHRFSPDQQNHVVKQMLETVGLESCEKCYPHELSGGQQQRVALARALAPQPRLLLLDEPFSSLDIELRERLSLEVRDILKASGSTAVMVTHDHGEAFAVSDKVGILMGGTLLQWDTPFNLYHRPVSRKVADFVGYGCFVEGKLSTPDQFETEVGVLKSHHPYPQPIDTLMDILLRPEDILIDPAGPLRATVIKKTFKGAETLYTLQLESGTRLLAITTSHTDLTVDQPTQLRIAADHLIAFTRLPQ